MASEDIHLKVILAIDESPSMDPTKQAVNLESLFAYADALKQVNPEIEICVVGFGDRVRVHAGFTERWGPDTKAHILTQVSTHKATDDERLLLDVASFLKETAPDAAQLAMFTDGLGMPGAVKRIDKLTDAGCCFVAFGVGPRCIGVNRYGQHGIYTRTPAQLPARIRDDTPKLWELAAAGKWALDIRLPRFSDFMWFEKKKMQNKQYFN